MRRAIADVNAEVLSVHQRLAKPTRDRLPILDKLPTIEAADELDSHPEIQLDHDIREIEPERPQ